MKGKLANLNLHTVYFKGYYGYKNIGDDVFCITADWICNHIWKDKKAIFIGEALPILSDNAMKIEITNSLVRKICELLVCIMVNNIIYFGGSVLSRGGTGLRDLKYYLGKLSFLFHAKLGTVGTSLGPFKTEYDRLSLREFLSKFSFIMVRDYSSLDIIRAMNIPNEIVESLCFDPAIVINEVFPVLKEKKHHEGKKIAVSLCHYERYINGDLNTEREREQAFLSLLIDIINNGDDIKEIVFFIFNGNRVNGDLEITKSFLQEIEHLHVSQRIVHYTNDTEKFLLELNDCDFLVGIRLHSGILAYALNIPFMLVEYHAKCTEFLNTIDHHHRFDVKNRIGNYDNYQLQDANGTHVRNPEYFKKIFIDEIGRLNEIL